MPTFSPGPAGWRRENASRKWEVSAPDVLPLSIADMDFPAPPAVVARLTDAVARADYGYPALRLQDRVAELAAHRMAVQHAWPVDPCQVRVYSTVLQPLQAAILAHTKPGDGILVHVPTYPGFLHAIDACDRRVIGAPLDGGRNGYRMNADRDRALARGNGVKMMVLCNPHNPTGRVWTPSELRAVAALAAELELIVVSDEIHGDIVYRGHRYVPLATQSEEIAKRTITVTSPGKAFAMTGLRVAVAIYGTSHLAEAAAGAMTPRITPANVLGLVAAMAAWEDGDAWRRAALRYLEGNRDMLVSFLASRMPHVGLAPPEGTFLAWLDLRAMALVPSPGEYLLRHARVAVNDGAVYGMEGYARLNFATHRDTLREVLKRIASALPAERAGPARPPLA